MKAPVQPFAVAWCGPGEPPFALQEPWFWSTETPAYAVYPAEGNTEVQPSELQPPQNTPVLSDRETLVLEYLADGWSNAEIANRLHLSLRTVKFHVEGIFRKLGVGRRTEAVREGLRWNLLKV